MDTEALNQLVNFGLAGIFALLIFKLYQDERKAHMDTIQRHIEDLRDIAGIRAQLGRTQSYVATFREENARQAEP